MLGLEPITYSVTPTISVGITQNHSQADSLSIKDVEHICNENGIPSNVVHGTQKQCRGGGGNVDQESIFTIALAHRNMASIMVKLGLQMCIYENYSHARGKRVMQVSGKNISINSVLSALSWTPKSYKNKLAWYKWAHDTVLSKQQKNAQDIPPSMSYFLHLKCGLDSLTST